MPFQSYSAVFPLILNDTKTEILLHLRQNTGYMDGFWDTAGSGHVDAGETALQAATRECREELGIEVATDQLEFAHLCHSVEPTGRTYYHIYFLVKHFDGTPTNMELEKAVELRWFPLDALPDQMVAIRKNAVLAWQIGTSYSEHFVE